MNKKIFKIISLCVMCISIVVGLFIIINSILGNNKISEEEYNKKMKEYNSQISEVNTEMNNEFINNGLSGKYYDLRDKSSQLSREKSSYDSKYNSSKEFGIFKIFPGIFIIVFGLTFSMIIYKFGTFSFDGVQLPNIVINQNIEDNSEKEYVAYKCPNCGNTNLKGNDQEKCEYCGSILQKVKKK